MVWGFSTEREFQAQLDWVDAVVRDEGEPLDVLFPGAVKSRAPKLRAIVDPLERPTRFAAAREKYAWVLAHDPELAADADVVERDLFARG